MKFKIETDRFGWGGEDTFPTEKLAREEVWEFLQSCRDNGQRGWRTTYGSGSSRENGEFVVLEYERVAWDPFKPDRVRIVRVPEVASATTG